MLTQEQGNWINHLSNKPGEIVVAPYDSASGEKFEKIRLVILSKLGKGARVEHHGASSFGISGQDEIDVYIPVTSGQYDSTVALMTELFGEPRSNYPLERTRFRTSVDGKKVDIFVINEQSMGWINCIKFENHLRNNPDELERYKKLKEANSGLSSQEYYRRKIEYINSLMTKI